MKSTVKKDFTHFAIKVGILVFISGIFYMLVQWHLINEIRDTVFISLSVGASIYILFFSLTIIKYLLDNGPLFYTSAIRSEAPELVKIEFDNLIGIFVGSRYPYIMGILWGLCAAFVPYLLDFWPDQTLITISCGIFLFFVCFITGYFLFILLRFFIISIKLWKLINVELWKRDSNTTFFLRFYCKFSGKE